MSLDLTEVKRISQVLFGQPDDELLSQAMGYMLVGQPESTVPGGFNYEAALKLCLKSASPMAVAKVIVAGVAASPLYAHFWLGEIERQFVLSIGEPSVKATPQFVLGTALGLFQAQCWLDEKCRWHTEFEKKLVKTLVTLCFCQHPATDSWLMSYSDQQYEAALSQAVKAWARPKANSSHIIGRRLAQIGHLIQLAYAETQRKDSDKKNALPKLAELVLDQVCYAQYGLLSTYGRLQALDLMFGQILTVPK